jgi:SAM-dependent methyltransferase
MTRPATYGAAFADVYDEWYSDTDDIASVVALLAEHSPRHVLELGVGTGRIAVPLALHLARHDDAASVTGIDESPEMLARLALNDRDALVRAVCGDMVDDQPWGPFDLVFVSYNTLFNVTERARQQRCIENVAARLAAGGRFVIDACIVDEAAPRHGAHTQRRGAWSLRTETHFDAATGIIAGTTTSTHDDGRCVRRPFRVAYLTPTTLDEVCASAGLGLAQRHGSWQRTACTADSARHVSVYRNLR